MSIRTDKRKPVKKPAKKKPAKARPGQTLYEQRRKIHSRCPLNYTGSECYIANQTECGQFRILQEHDARCPGDPSRW